MPENKKLFEVGKIENFWGGDFLSASADLIAVREGIKKVARVEYHDNEDLEKYKKILKENKLEFISSNKKLFETFSLYISQDKALAQKAKLADPSFKIIDQKKSFNEVVDSVRDFGNLLSYPKCCLEKYIQNTLDNIKLGEAEVFKSLPSKISFLFNNQLNGLSNFYLSFHMPCSFGCKKSQSYLEKIFKAVKKASPDFSLKLTEHLKNPFLVFFDLTQPGLYASWDKRQGFIFDGKIIGQELCYSAVIFFKTNYPEFQGAKDSSQVASIQEKIKEGNRLVFSAKGFTVFKDKKKLFSWENSEDIKSYLFNFI
ncbi:MAG TPA: DUF483 domain-containing protein [Candidatus Portnoybacteria bacterium]|nr:DUF483 domain-containing protein [Candidatus Portnoybacteria bacterium]